MLNPRSTASIAGHPIHPMLIPFPIAFFVGTFVCDLVYWQTSNSAWATATPWLLGAGLVMAALAAVMGMIDVFGDHQIRQLSTVWWHASANVLVVLIELYNLFARYQQGPRRSFPMACCCPWSRFSSCCSAGGKAEIWCSAVMSALRIIEKNPSDGQDVQGRRSRELEFGSRTGARKNSQSA
jgi:uncharacterized membrane protein